MSEYGFFQEEEYPLIQQNLTSMHQWMTEQGIKFYMIYLPNKEDVYGEYMGHHIKKRTRPEADRFSLVVEYLQQQEAPLVPIYPLNRMLEEKNAAMPCCTTKMIPIGANTELILATRH